ncbi:putative reverse transcriptase domain-containing protein [Tanacetum coccineum]
MLKLRHLYPKELLMHWQNTKQTEAEMAMTAMIQGVTEEGECLTIGHDAAYVMSWKTLKKMMTDKYCPRGEIKKLEIELWNLKVKGTDVESYNQRFQELTLMYGRMYPKESDEVEKMQLSLELNRWIKRFVLWLNVKLKMKGSLRTFQGTIKTNSGLSRGIMWHGPILQGLGKRNRTEDLNLCAYKCFSIIIDSVAPNVHFKSNFLKLKNKNQGNQAGNGNVVARAYAVGAIGTNPNSNVVTGTFLLNNCYALILFDTGSNRSFVSTAFSSLIDIIPTTLGHGYGVVLADGKIL